MKTLQKYMLPILIFFGHSISCYSQFNNRETNYDFIPRERIIFKDDFSRDSIGKFPPKWKLSKCNNASLSEVTKRWCTVRNQEGEHFMEIDTGNVFFILPDVSPLSYLNDSFTFECDLALVAPTSAASIEFILEGKNSDCATEDFYLGRTSGNAGFALTNEGHTPQYHISKAICPSVFHYADWHHFAFSYNKKEIKCYVDQYRMLVIPDCGYAPTGIVLGTKAPMKYRNFRLATGNETNFFDKIQTDKKFVTHAIHFDVNIATIKQESMGYIVQLSIFLNTHPDMVIEIDGHTDSDGEAAANIKLSQERADEVKKQLVVRGIATHRLIARGLGATKPVKPNTTPEGKAENRRVEFIKQ